MSAPPFVRPDDRPAVFLDFDGTLVEIAERPELTRVPSDLRDTLERAHANLEGALAVITGRPLVDLDALLAPLELPAAGVHGAEHRADPGIVHTLSEMAFPAPVRRRVQALAAADDRLIAEDKGHAMALHFRQAPDQAGRIRGAFEEIRAELGPEFTLQDGKMVVELRPARLNKGTAVERFMERAPFTGRLPIFIGDDVTDEDAFAAINRMGGMSIRVGPPDRDTVAQYALSDVQDVHDWLMPMAKGAEPTPGE